jgi:phospho-N-acetylmuramoyl-pentapeptide-transferase
MITWLIDSIASGLITDAHGAGHLLALRILLACALAALPLLCFGPWAVQWLARRFREPVKSGSAELDRLHQAKQSTPTMGGILIVGSVLLAVLAIGDVSNRATLLGLVVMVGLAFLGAIDDLVKLRTSAAGLGWRAKLLGQVCVAAIPAICFYTRWCGPAEYRLPLMGTVSAGVGWTIIPWTILVIVASSNAVNLADGLDGLAAGCLLLATLAIGAISYGSSAHVAPELLVVAGAMIGALLAFLPVNRHPAQVFMGNVGALSLGGLLGLLALGTGTELLLPLVGGVFVAEAASVILQLTVYRWTKRRILRCAPLHHHFEFLGWPERTIVRRFWLASAACAAAGIALWSFP